MLRILFFVLFLLAALWFGGFIWFIAATNSYAVPLKNLNKSDAIVVFTGGGNRVTAGFDLLLKNKAENLFISGVDAKASLYDLLRTANLKMDHVPCCVALGRQAADTIGNAAETSNWMQQKKFNSMILVTSNFHMPRALLEMKILAHDINVQPYPVETDAQRSWRNWHHSYVWRFHLMEYHKYIYALLRYKIKR